MLIDNERYSLTPIIESPLLDINGTPYPRIKLASSVQRVLPGWEAREEEVVEAPLITRCAYEAMERQLRADPNTVLDIAGRSVYLGVFLETVKTLVLDRYVIWQGRFRVFRRPQEDELVYMYINLGSKDDEDILSISVDGALIDSVLFADQGPKASS